MKFKRLPQAEIPVINKIVRVETEDEDDEDVTITEDEDTVKAGDYALDDHGRVWKLDPGLTGLFQAFEDEGPKQERVRKPKA